MSPQEQKYYNETILPRLEQLKLSPNSSYGLQVSDMMLARYRQSQKNQQRVQQTGTNLKPQMLNEVTVKAPKLTAKTTDNSDTTPLTKGTSWTSELDNETKTALGNGVSYDANKARSGEREAQAAANKVGLGLGAIGLSVAAAPVIGNTIGAIAPHAMQLGYRYIPKAMHYLNYISPGTSEFFSMSTPLQLGVGLMDAATTAGAVSNFIDNPGITSGVEAAMSTLPYYSAFRTQKLIPKFGASKFQHNVTNFTNSKPDGNPMQYLANLIQGGDDEIKLFSMLKSNSPSINYDELMKLFNNLTPEQLNELQKVGFDLEQFYKNLSENLYEVKNLQNKTYYHDAITGDDLIREFLKLGRPDEPVNINKELIGNFYTNDVWPRLMRNLKEQGINLTQEQIKELEPIIKTPWEGVDMKYGYTQPGSGGYSLGPYKIRYKFGIPVSDSTVAHELHHSYRDRLANFFKKHNINIGDVNKIMSEDQLSTNKSRKESQQLFPQYLGNELEAMRPFKFNSEDLGSLTPTAEQGATLAELRFKIFNEFLRQKGRTPSVEELDFIIDKMSKEGYLLNGTADYTLINTSYGRTFYPNFLKRKDAAVNNAMNITSEKLAKRDISDKPEWFSYEEWKNILNETYPKRKWWQLTKPKVGFDVDKYNHANYLAEIRSESKERRLINNEIANGLKRVAGYTIPITIGANAISNEKNGGSLNYIFYLKSGGSIHIKPENRGKFTEYCGGKVTDECIQRAKRSGNKKLIKRAVFAENARKWKH